MIELCRPEIEAQARDAYLSDTNTALDKHRENTLSLATAAATSVVDGVQP